MSAAMCLSEGGGEESTTGTAKDGGAPEDTEDTGSMQAVAVCRPCPSPQHPLSPPSARAAGTTGWHNAATTRAQAAAYCWAGSSVAAASRQQGSRPLHSSERGAAPAAQVLQRHEQWVYTFADMGCAQGNYGGKGCTFMNAWGAPLQRHRCLLPFKQCTQTEAWGRVHVLKWTVHIDIGGAFLG